MKTKGRSSAKALAKTEEGVRAVRGKKKLGEKQINEVIQSIRIFANLLYDCIDRINLKQKA